LGRSAANPQRLKSKDQHKVRSVLLKEMEGWALPTGKWYKGFFFQSPTNLNAHFVRPQDSTDPEDIDDTIDYSVMALPNKLKLDDRIGMVSVYFPRRSYIDVDHNPNSVIYDLSNTY